MKQAALPHDRAVERSREALIRLDVPPAMSSVFLDAYQKALTGKPMSSSPFAGQGGGYMESWNRFHAMGVRELRSMDAPKVVQASMFDQ